MWRPLIVLVAALLTCRSAPAGEQAIVTSDLLRLRQVNSIDVSRDGMTAVYAVRSIAESAPVVAAPGASVTPGASGVSAAEPDGDGPEYEYRVHLFVADLRDAAAAPRQITFGPRQDGGPVLSPDGKRVAFVRAAAEPHPKADGDDDRGSQVWVIDLRGGEARQVTNFEHGAGDPRWSSDGRRLLVHTDVPIAELGEKPPWEQERPGRPAPAPDKAITPRLDGTRQEIALWLRGRADRFDPSVINRLHFQGEQSLRREMTFTQISLVDVDDEAAKPRRLTHDFYDHADARFVGPQGAIVYVTSKPATQHPDRVRQRALWIMEVDGSGDRPLLALDGWALSSPQPTLDGSLIAFAADQLDEPAYRVSQLGIVPISGGAGPTWLTPRFENGVSSFQWLPARSSILFTSEREGGFPLMEISTGLLEPVPLVETVEGVPAGVHAMAAGGGTIVYALTTPTRPCVLRTIDGRGDRLLQDLNPWVADKRLSEPRGAWIKRPDGTRVQWWIMEPTRREPAKKYPLVLEMHGGPSAMWGPGELTMWHEFQLLCSWGFGVVFSNPRGSGGYGNAFLRGNFQNWGDGPAGDVLAALDQAMLEPWVDADRLVLTGGSYAGYLTAWIVAHDKRFKAAVAQRGVYDLETFFGEGNAWELVPWAMGGFPWDGRYRPVIDRESPFTYVNRIQTPLLIMHASQDLRTGVSQSEMMYRALKAMERPVEYVRYPDAGHDLSRSGDPGQRMDRLNRIIEFFERFVDNPRPAPEGDATGR